MREKLSVVTASQSPVSQTQGLAWLLAVLDGAAKCLDECGRDVDARVIEAHRAQLVRGQHWPGDPITEHSLWPDTDALSKREAEAVSPDGNEGHSDSPVSRSESTDPRWHRFLTPEKQIKALKEALKK